MILVADSDDAVTDRLVPTLERAGIATLHAGDGGAALLAIGAHRPTAILLGPELPLVPTSTVVATTRGFTRAPILLGCGPGQEHLVGEALIAGATGLIGRPYKAEEVVSSLRRHGLDREAIEHRIGRLRCGSLELDPLAYRVTFDGKQVRLPRKEFELLRLLMLNVDQVVPMSEIRGVVWSERPGGISANTVSTHVARLRQRIGHAALITVRGVGYRLDVHPDRSESA